MPAAAWGPGWVSWGIAADYVAWCPLGWNDSPVFGLSVGISAGWHSDPWRGWTVTPQRAFGRGGHVPSYALRREHLGAVERSRFEVYASGPSGSARAASRGAVQQPFGSSSGRAQSVADARVGSARERSPLATAASLSTRPGAPQRSGIVDALSQRPSEQAMAAERLRRLAADQAAAPGRYATEPFASPSQSPLPYPNRFRAPAASERREAGSAAVPRSSTYRIHGAGASAPSRSQPPSDPGPSAAPSSSAAGLPSPRPYRAPGLDGARPSAPPSNVDRGSPLGGLPANVGRGGSPGGPPPTVGRGGSTGGLPANVGRGNSPGGPPPTVGRGGSTGGLPANVGRGTSTWGSAARGSSSGGGRSSASAPARSGGGRGRGGDD